MDQLTFTLHAKNPHIVQFSLYYPLLSYNQDKISVFHGTSNTVVNNTSIVLSLYSLEFQEAIFNASGQLCAHKVARTDCTPTL